MVAVLREDAFVEDRLLKIEADVSHMRSEVAEMKQDIREVKEDVTVLKGDVEASFERLRSNLIVSFTEVNKKIDTKFTEIDMKVVELRGDMKTGFGSMKLLTYGTFICVLVVMGKVFHLY